MINRKLRRSAIVLASMIIGGAYSSVASARGDALEIYPPDRESENQGYNTLVATSVGIAGNYSVMGTPIRTNEHQGPGGAYVFVNGNSTPIQDLTISPGTIDYEPFHPAPYGGGLMSFGSIPCVLTQSQINSALLGEEVAMSEGWVALSANNLGVTATGSGNSTCTADGRVSTIFLAKANDVNTFSNLPYKPLEYTISVPHGKPVEAMAMTDDDLVMVTEDGVYVFSYNDTLDDWQYNRSLPYYDGLNIVTTDENGNSRFDYHPVAIDDNLIAFGNGKWVDVYEKSSQGAWSLKAYKRGHYFEFGRSVDIDGNHMIVGHGEGVNFYEVITTSTDSYVNLLNRFTPSEGEGGRIPDPEVVAISEGELNGVLVKRAVAYFPNVPLTHETLDGEIVFIGGPGAGIRKTFELNPSSGKFDDVFHMFGSTASDYHWHPGSLAMDGNSLVIGVPFDRPNVGLTADREGLMIFDRFASLFGYKEKITPTRPVIDNAETQAKWFNEGKVNWFRLPLTGWYFLATPEGTPGYDGNPGTQVDPIFAGLKTGNLQLTSDMKLIFDYYGVRPSGISDTELGRLTLQIREEDEGSPWTDTGIDLNIEWNNQWHTKQVAFSDLDGFSDDADDDPSNNLHKFPILDNDLYTQFPYLFRLVYEKFIPGESEAFIIGDIKICRACGN